jgi:HAD superfamily hydrolase (TIGR01509 family)
MIEAVAFDYGGVLSLPFFDGFAELEADLGLPAEALSGPLRSGAVTGEAEIGRRGIFECFDDWRRRLRSEFGVDLDLGRVLAALAPAAEANPATLDLVDRLAGRYRLAVVTNNIAELAGRWREAVSVDRFELVIDSSEVGLRKPEPAIYALLLERLGLDGEQVVFVDDSPENVAGAAEAGLHAVLFTDAAALEARLRELGVEPGRGPR